MHLICFSSSSFTVHSHLLIIAWLLVELLSVSNSAPLNITADSADGQDQAQKVQALASDILHKDAVLMPAIDRPDVVNDIMKETVKRDELHHQPQLLLPTTLKIDSDEKLKFVTQKPNDRDNLDIVLASQTPFIIIPLKLEEVQPPDHIEGLRVEQDGHLNSDYKKEIIIGNHDEFEHSGSEKKLLSRLKVVFFKADTNHDSFLTHAELKAWIMVKVNEHLEEAKLENARIFRHLDTDHDGFVSWKEFHIHFLLAKGHAQNDTLQQVDDYDTLAIDPADRERLIRYKFRWAEADQSPPDKPDNKLTVEELRNFRHPEQNSKMIIQMAKDLIDNLDRNEDGIITEEEFVVLPNVDFDGMMHDRGADEVWQNERRKEFQNVIDINHDGKVDIEELKLYVDPHNENHAHLEADNLVQLADQNADGKLSIDEVLDNAELFLGSKMVDTGRNFHDEF